MDSDFRAFLETPEPGAKPPRRHRGYNAFGWAVCFLLLMGVVMASWIGSFYVFSHPENPDCYHLLKELNRIEPLKRFEITAAPPGKFFTAKELYDAYVIMPPEQLAEKNNELLRDYLRNYTNVKTPVPYISGRFNTTGVYELGKKDLFPSGMVAVANSAECPYVQIENIYPTDFSNVPRARQLLATEPEIDLEKTFDLSTVVHIQKLENGRMLFTVIPLSYGQCAYKQGISSTFRLDPPSSLNLEAAMPLVKTDAMDDAVKLFTLYRKNRTMLAKGKMLTIPPPAPLQTTDLLTAQDIPAEATQPYKPVIPTPEAEPAPSAPESTVAASAPPPVTAPVEMVPPVSSPSSAETVTTAQIPAAPAPAPEIAKISPPPPPPVVASTAPVAPVLPHAVATSVKPAPVIAKISPPSPPPVVASTAPVAPVLPHAVAAPVKSEKPVAKISPPALSPAAPGAKPVVRITSNPAPATVITTAHPAASKPAVSVAYTSQSHIPVKSTMAAAPVPFPIVERADPAQAPAVASTAVEYAKSVPLEPTSTGVKLTPFLASQQASIQQAQPQTPAMPRSATWQTYRPGMMPRGKLINMYGAPQLADLGVGRDPLYVQGRFIVTASSDGRAVLRPVNVNGGISETSMRMLVEYP